MQLGIIFYLQSVHSQNGLAHSCSVFISVRGYFTNVEIIPH